MTCRHETTCPSANSHDARAVAVVAYHWEQGWALLCNGLLVFDDEGVLAPVAASGVLVQNRSHDGVSKEPASLSQDEPPVIDERRLHQPVRRELIDGRPAVHRQL